MEDKSEISHSELLELAATDDLRGFIDEVERGINVNECRLWYGRSFGSKKMGFEERTPIMIASLYGSTEVLSYIVKTCKVDANKACGSDRATALHCAAAGGAWSSLEVVELLLGSSADINSVDASGKKPRDLIASCVKSSFKSSSKRRTLELLLNGGETAAAAEEKDCYRSPVDRCLPDINNGVYGCDEFRMYSFKVKPCSRAYSHDWTECPFVHPGENARRRDPRKYNYTCVPCPEFKKGSCSKGDHCEYAHGVFESWLHPAQYRTRLCKDEVGCARKICFFAHRYEELRPLYASTGSALPSPKSFASAKDLTGLSPLTLGLSSTPPISPMWQSKVHQTPPALQLSSSRLKASSTSPYNLVRDLKPTNLDELFDLSQLQLQSQSPRLNTNHLRASYPTTNNASSSPARKPSVYGFDSSAAVAAAVMNARSSAFSNRSHSFIDRGGVGYLSGQSPSMIANWGSPDGKLDWGFNGDDASKLRKSASFGIRTGAAAMNPEAEWGVSSPVRAGGGGGSGGGVREMMMPLWMDQRYKEQEQMVA